MGVADLGADPWQFYMLITKGFCKIEVRHILFKKICFFDFLK